MISHIRMQKQREKEKHKTEDDRGSSPVTHGQFLFVLNETQLSQPLHLAIRMVLAKY
jgi:hypothetical protein